MSYISKTKNSTSNNLYKLSTKGKDSSLLKKQNIIITPSQISKINSNTNSNEQLVNKSTNSFRQQGMIINKFKTTKNSPDRNADRNFSDDKGKVVIHSNVMINNQNIISNYEKYNQNTTTNNTYTTNNSNPNSNYTSTNNNVNNQELELLKKKLFKKSDKSKTTPLNFTNSKGNVSNNKIQFECQNKHNSTVFLISNNSKNPDAKKEMNCTVIKHNRTPSNSKNEAEGKVLEKIKFNNLQNNNNKISPRMDSHTLDPKIKNDVLTKIHQGKSLISTPKSAMNNSIMKHQELLKQSSASKIKPNTSFYPNCQPQHTNTKDNLGNIKEKTFLGNNVDITQQNITNPIDFSRKNSNEKKVGVNGQFNTCKQTTSSKSTNTANTNNTTTQQINNNTRIYTQEDAKKSCFDDKMKKNTPKKSLNIVNSNISNVNNSKLNISNLIKTKNSQQPVQQAPITSVPATKLHSKNTSKSSSRIEEKPEIVKKSDYDSVKKIDIKLPNKPSQTKTPSLQSTINNIKNNSTNQFKKHATTTNSPKNTINMNFNKEAAKKSINTPTEKGGKQLLSLKLNLNNLNPKEVVVKDKKHLKEREIKNNNSLNFNNMSIDNILETSNCSVKSSLRESNYYKKESEKFSNYIKLYYNKHNEYPQTNVKSYKYGRLIGKGAFGKVNLGLHTLTGRLVAIKSFNKKNISNENARKKIYYETNLMKNLKHNAIVKIYEMFETPNYIMIIMEYVSCGDLLSFVRKRSKLSENIAKLIFRQIIEALQYIQSQNIVHRDIKLDNILIDLSNNIKICDFGVSKQIKKGELMKEQCGTPAYISPEILNNQGYEGYSVDIWSAGVVLYAMLSGTVPFKANNMSDLHKLILKGNPPKIKEVSDEANNLIYGLLETDPKKRWNVEQILCHVWLKNNNDNNGKFKSKMNLFTNAEKILLSKSNIDFRIANKDDLIENFTIRNLDTLQEIEQQNVHTKSVILAPFSSSMKCENQDYNSFLSQELKIENDGIKFIGKAKEANRNYELNNNGEIDNGILINPDPENLSVKDDSPMLSPHSNSLKEINPKSKPNSPPEINNYDVTNNKILSEIPSPDNNSNRNSRKFRENNSSTSNANTFIIDENVIKQVEELGYKREFLMKALYSNEHNYATTAYYLLLNSKLDV